MKESPIYDEERSGKKDKKKRERVKQTLMKHGTTWCSLLLTAWQRGSIVLVWGQQQVG